MACRLPGHCNSPQALWEFLERGGVADNAPPATRFNLAGHHDKHKRPRTMKSPGGMFIEDIDPEVFDGKFFNISKVDCIAMDPQQRQLLEVTYECLENAGLPLEHISGKKIGCIVGANASDYEGMQSRDPEDRPDSATIGVARSILSNRISHFLNIKGPSMTVDTACSGSLVSLDVACRYLDTYQADGMIVAGANIWMNPEHNEEIGMMRMTQSASGKCHTFDAKADGYVKAEAINVVTIKRLDDAIRDGDPIRAIIRGTSTNSAGRTPGLASPSSEAQADAIRAAYANAGIKNFHETGYLECHGTATLVGDGIELIGAASVFAASRAQGQELIIGSIKSNIGHSEAAAGISGLIKAILAVERGIIPGNPTFLQPNPKIDFEGLRVRATRASINWPNSTKRRASLNSFGFGGANAHVVLEQADHSWHHSSHIPPVGHDFFTIDEEETLPKLLVFSANDEYSLKRNIKTLSGHIMNPSTSLHINDLAYTLSEKRSRLYYRGFVVTKTSSIPEESVIFSKRKSNPPRIAFIFTGQGAQWSQMGQELLSTFPSARRVIEQLDDVLQALEPPPSWKLLTELTQVRSSEALRLPEFSQPLVTALQLALIEVLREWNIIPQSVVGHSSGEIAAAAAAGLISSEDAIKIAYYRGQAAKYSNPGNSVGMLAVGIGATEIQKYLESLENVQIACYNSPNSVTLSGETAELNKAKELLEQDHVFSRSLLVNLAYHSSFMTDLAERYVEMLAGSGIEREDPEGLSLKDNKVAPVKFYSSVTGSLHTGSLDSDYWKMNMISPVRFDAAMNSLLQDSESADFLVEIGPSNSLAGPIAQIQKFNGEKAAGTQYTYALKRGTDAIIPLFEVAGRIFLAGGSPDLASVNQLSCSQPPKLVVDLPNYSWNHTEKYWHESTASRDWRFKPFVMHDLLGSKVNGTPWNSPIFKKTLKLSDTTWLKDHKLGAQVVFPGAAYIAMSMEAVYQTTFMTTWKQEVPSRFRYRLRDVRFSRAIVLEEDSDARIMLSLTPVPGSTRSWFEYKVYSLREDIWTEHGTGLIRIETDYKEKSAPAKSIEPLKHATPGRSWYKALAAAGYNFGPAFQKHLMVESTTGKRASRSTVSMIVPESSYEQSFYPMHPASIDGCFQTVSPALWEGDRTTVGTVLVPSVISSLIISGRGQLPDEAISIASATYSGLGRRDAHKNYGTSCSVYHPASGDLLLQLEGLKFAELETSEDEKPVHTFTHLLWDADISLLLSKPEPRVKNILEERFIKASSHTMAKMTKQERIVQDLLGLIAHKNPRLTMAELNLDSTNESSLWLDEKCPKRAACSLYHFATTDPKVLLGVQEKHQSSSSNIGFGMVDLTKAGYVLSGTEFDLILIKIPGSLNEQYAEIILESMRMSMKEDGLLLIVAPDNSESDFIIKNTFGALGNLQSLGENTYSVQCIRQSPDSGIIAGDSIQCFSLSGKDFGSLELLKDLENTGWTILTSQSTDHIQPNQTVLVLDELLSPVMDCLDEGQWYKIQSLVEKECKILWVTTGAQANVMEPTRAAINGFARVLRAEAPLLSFMTLDVEQPEGPTTAEAIHTCLDLMRLKKTSQTDSEFVERNGILHVSRVFPENELSRSQEDGISSLKTELIDLHDSKIPIRLRAEIVGNADSILFGEISPYPLPLQPGGIEIELYAAGMNYKDVVLTMGIVPGDEHAIGGEGAGIITRISPEVRDFEVGQRVVVFDKGCFANRIQTTPGRVHRIPDNMTFEDASTLSAVYLTSMYGLFDLAKLEKGQRVLIHSAAGGVGIAAIQLCQYIGAEIYVTVGTEEKRTYLKSTFGIPDSQIFNSRNTDFASDVVAATGGRGVDVVLNSLTGDLLDESWRLLADGGTMIEIGKKDILDRNMLAMEPFDRNMSFRAIDMSHERAPDHLVNRLLSALFELIERGHVKPIAPIHTFSFSDVPSAIRFLRAGKHIGKIVISDGPSKKIIVPVRKAPKPLKFSDDSCYLIVGGLKGLCASLAIYFAKIGVKHLAVMSRSGYADEKSQGVISEIEAMGCKIDLLTADVTVEGDVEKAFRETTKPIGGIVQGAMVLRDRTFSSMSIADYHEAIDCKIKGTWNLHNVAEKLTLPLTFFTMLSSISGLVGQKGQANYAAGNAFLDAFASYRHGRGQPACSVDLGVIEDVGYIAERDGMQDKLDTSIWSGINERLLQKILYFSILQQQGDAPFSTPSTQIITGIPVPQPESSALALDVRFAGLFTPLETNGGAGGSDGKDSAFQEVQAVLLLLRSKTVDPAAQLAATIDIVNKVFVRVLRLSEPMEVGRPIAVYGIDSLGAIEVRNWIRIELGALMTTLEIVNAVSLISLCKKIVAKIVAS
ncbi:putative polyketide synthase protein [Botrytis fragariae]|uniref:Putative polyketide synthase protein n=1 Tax=Botrytis fragariae TaxID=1964551 RepID=A0A8H6B273_9HELO|nr:putative polyketide synthase protein [Botrytis fragariae]KAF5878019.1 putative polyketide synthase protein [Botrytis fragariae]